MELVDFLHQRLDEDEAAAKAAGGVQWEVGSPNRRIVAAPWQPGERWSQPEYIAAFVAQDPLADACRNHIVRHDPARALREVEAKRQLLQELWTGMEDFAVNIEESRDGDDRGAREYRDQLLGILALAYADHADYQEAWRV